MHAVTGLSGTMVPLGHDGIRDTTGALATVELGIAVADLADNCRLGVEPRHNQPPVVGAEPSKPRRVLRSALERNGACRAVSRASCTGCHR